MVVIYNMKITIKSVINHKPLLIKNITFKFVSCNPFDNPIWVVVWSKNMDINKNDNNVTCL